MRRPGYIWLALLAAACGGTEPIELAGSYKVHTVNGEPPPQLVGAALECDVSVGGGRLIVGAADHFELGLDVLTDCSRGGGSTTEATYGYTGTVQVNDLRVAFHTARGGNPFSFEGQLTSSGRIGVVVPLLVPLADAVTVEFEFEQE